MISTPRQDAPPAPARGLIELELALLIVLVCVIYFTRLAAPNLRGEETRRGQVAVEMIQTSDWIVPRQQGQLFLSRPPLQNWLIGLLGLVRDGVDDLAVRLPSAVATILLAGLIYGYARGCLSPVGALVAGLSFATMIQVIELGRLGETEALFTLAVGGSLLVWHWGWTRGRSRLVTWCLAYVLAAAGMLLKGPQGPVFFAGPVGMYLIATRQWRELVTWSHAAGIALFFALWNAWQLPYYVSVGGEATWHIYRHDVAMRFADRSWTTILKHLAVYPLEIFVCQLPWSPLLAVCLSGSFWNRLKEKRPYVIFLVCCIVATFPAVWFVPGARSRYYMPLYPCFAVLIALAAEHCWQSAAKAAWQNAWRQLVGGLALVMVAAGIGVGLAGLLPQPAGLLVQPLAFAIPYLLASLLLAGVAWWSAAGLTPAQQRAGCIAVAAFVALAYVGVVTNIRVNFSNDTQQQIAELKRRLPAGAKLVSFGLLDHMFTFYFCEPIEALAEVSSNPPPPEESFFCFRPTAGSQEPFDFAWEPVAVISCDRNRRPSPERTIVVARRLPQGAATSVASRLPVNDTSDT